VAFVNSVGGEVTGSSNHDTLLQGWLPIDALADVAAHADVYYIRRPPEMHLFETLHIGGSTTEGLAVINGPAWHAAGYTGSGVKVGVIDGGFEDYLSLLGTDLPSSSMVKMSAISTMTAIASPNNTDSRVLRSSMILPLMQHFTWPKQLPMSI
jgi:hypothetical protein